VKEILYYPFTLWFVGMFARVLKDVSGVNYMYGLIVGLIISYISFAIILF
jgi:tetrahydromethanopterin S-methyltransferase subunit G